MVVSGLPCLPFYPPKAGRERVWPVGERTDGLGSGRWIIFKFNIKEYALIY